MKQLFLSLSLSLIIAANAAGQHTFGGGGTTGDPYTIANAEQLAELATLVNQNNSDYKNKSYKLIADIDLNNYGENYNNGEGWIPIGNYDYRFEGIFDGNGKKITGLYLKYNNNYDYYIGLFGYINQNAEIKNLGIENVNILGRSDVGGVAGYADNMSSITYCYVTGELEGNSYIGGIAGTISGSSNISKCYSTADIKSNVSAFAPVGGIAGACSLGCSIDNCYSTGAVNGFGYYTGGIVGCAGTSNGTELVSYCYSTGAIISSSDYIGGIAGSFYLKNCAALNTCVKSTFGGIGRLTNSSYMQSGNRAFVYLLDKDGEYNLWDNKLHNQKNGADMSAAEAVSSAFWTTTANWSDAAWDNDIWTFTEGRLPVLKNVGGEQSGEFWYNKNPKNLKDAVVVFSRNILLYNGDDQIPGMTVKFANTTLNTNDYDMSFSSDSEGEAGKDPGLVTMTLTGKGNYTGTKSETYTIIKMKASGAGTESQPLQITNAEQLAELAELVNAGKLDVKLYVKLMNDIDLSDYGANWKQGWIAIGTDNNPFKGEFDGNGKVITGLYINSFDYSVGLFGAINSSTIKNIGIVDANIKAQGYIGGVVGIITNNSIVSSCYVTGTMEGTWIAIGGVVGEVSDGCIITNCYSTAKVSHTNNNSNYGLVGGIVGEIGYGAISISNCYATGAVSGQTTDVGGVAGAIYLTSTGTNCVALNPSVICEKPSVGRVTSYNYNGNYTNFHAFEGMMDVNGTTASWTNKTHDGKDGADVSASTVITKAFWENPSNWSGSGWDQEIWSFDDGRLPILKNIGGDQSGDFWYFNRKLYDAVVTLSANIFLHTGEIQTPTFTLKFLGVELIEGTDYEMEITSDNGGVAGKDEGTHTITFTGKGEYSGSATAKFTIVKMTAAGEGTEAHPLEITTAAEFAEFASFVNAGKLDFRIYVKLMNDIDLSDYGGWPSIGGMTYRFKGFFDGNGNTISNLFINNNSSWYYNGLFGSITESAIIQNLCLANVNINGGSYTGGIAGDVSTNSSIINCYVTGTINGSINVGGIAGEIVNSRITNCYSTATVSGANSVVGGIGGYIYSNYSVASVDNCVALNPSVSGDNYVGRIAGRQSTSYDLQNNYALDTMADKNGTTASWNEKTLSGKDGADVSAASQITKSFWTTAGYWAGSGWDEDIWRIIDGKLPYFKKDYSIELSETGVYIFANANYGYSAQSLRTITVTNTGINPTGSLLITRSGNDAESFTITDTNTAGGIVAEGGTASFYLRPTTGLAVGTHTATITVSGANGISSGFQVSFTVERASVTNSGGAATVTHNGESFDLSSINNLFTISANAGERTYTVETGGTGVGTIAGDNKTLTVTKAGTINIGLTTAATANYAAGAKVTATLTVNKGDGAAVAAPVEESKTHNSITVGIVEAPDNGQEIEYAISETNVAPVGGWSDSPTFEGLIFSTTYYVFARSQGNDLYNTGTASVSAAITTYGAPVFNTAGTAEQTYSGAPINLSTIAGLFTIDPNAGAPTYTLETDGATGEGVIAADAKTLTVTKAGIFKIGLTTAANGNYAPSAKVVATLTVNKAAGASADAPTLVSRTGNSITISSGTTSNQTIEYARAATATPPSTGWQQNTIFTGLQINTSYYFFARTMENELYLQGVASEGISYTTDNKIPVNNIAGAATITFSLGSIDLSELSELFTVAFGAGARSYTVETGGTGEGKIAADAKTLTVTKAGEIKIGLATAEQGNYAAGEKVIATLTVNKAKGEDITDPPFAESVTYNSITIKEIPPATNGQKIEYTYSTVSRPLESSVWLESRTMTGLKSDTRYYMIARAKENDNYLAGAYLYNTARTALDLTGNGEIPEVNPLQAWFQNGVLYISGLTKGAVLAVYNISGVLLYQGVAGSETEEIPLAVQGVYIILSDGKTVKVTN